MYRLLIVEDEELLRKSLCVLVDWESAGVSVAGAVENGVAALRFLETNKVDLVMTDIRMPVMDGLELACELQSRYPSVKTVLCSAYSEFSFAQKAMEYGVYGYLLKSQDEDEIAEYFKKLCEKLDREHTVSFRSERPTGTLWTKREALSLRLLDSPIPGDSDALREEGTVCKLDLRDRPMAAMLLTLDGAPLLREELGAFSMRQLEKVLAEQVLSSLEWAGSGYLLQTGVPLAALWTDLEEGWEERLNDLHRVLSDELDAFETSLPVTLTISIGKRVDSISKLPASWESAKEALNAKFYLGGNRVCDAQTEGILEPSLLRAEELEAALQKAARLCEERDPAGLFAFLEELKRELQSRKITDRTSCGILCARLTLLLTDAAGKWGDTDLQLTIKSGELMNALSLCETLGALFERLLLFGTEQLGLPSHGASGGESKQPKRIVEKVLTYLRENYASDLSLEQAAAYVSVHPVHLSRLFRQETSQTFKTVLTQIRMAKAKELLADLDLKVYEISERVGYKKPRYFSELFKEITGMTPLEYREKR